MSKYVIVAPHTHNEKTYPAGTDINDIPKACMEFLTENKLTMLESDYKKELEQAEADKKVDDKPAKKADDKPAKKADDKPTKAKQAKGKK